MKPPKPESAKDDPAAAVGYLLRLLTRRDYTQAELKQRMTRRGLSQDVQQAALDRLGELDLLDDERIAQAHVRGKSHRKGRLALRQELRQRGVAPTLVDQALAPLDDAQQASAAQQVLEKSAWRFQGPDTRKNRGKAATFLARRGFTSDIVREVIETNFPWDSDDNPEGDHD